MQPGNSANARGLDVSEWQGVIDWPAVRKAGKTFAMIRASYGTTITDAMFAANWVHAPKAGLVVGAYHFAVPSEPANAQVAYFLAAINRVRSYHAANLPPMLDLEQSFGLTDAALRDWAVAFCEGVDAAIGNPEQKMLIYSYLSFIQEFPLTFAALSDRGLWIADLSASVPNVGPWKEWTAWQYADTGTVPGIQGAVDLDEWYTAPDGLVHVPPAPTLTPEIKTLQAQVIALQAEVTAKDQTIAHLSRVVGQVQADVKGAS